MRSFVIGDLQLDVDVFCRATRLCEEAPVPVLLKEGMFQRCGGAANVAVAMASLGSIVWVAGRLGSCNTSQPLIDLLRKEKIRTDFVRYSHLAKTTTKTRFIDIRDGIARLMVRIDEESTQQSENGLATFWLNSIKDVRPDAVIVADHGKGVVTDFLMHGLSELEIPVYVDPTPLTAPESQMIWVGSKKEIPTGATGVLIEKKGKYGLSFHSESESFELPAANLNPVDTLGAGDSFIAALAYARWNGLSWKSSANWASIAAGLQCGRNGIVPVLLKDLPPCVPGFMDSLPS